MKFYGAIWLKSHEKLGPLVKSLWMSKKIMNVLVLFHWSIIIENGSFYMQLIDYRMEFWESIKIGKILQQNNLFFIKHQMQFLFNFSYKITWLTFAYYTLATIQLQTDVLVLKW